MLVVFFDVINLNPLQRDLLRAIVRQDVYISVRGGWGSGKTSGLVLALLTISKLRPGSASLLVTDTSPRYRTVLQPELEKWLSPLGWQWSQLQSSWSDPSTGSSVWCRSYFRPGTRDASHNPLEGINVSGIALVDECQTMSEEVAHKCLGRLRSGPSPILVMCGLPVVDAWWCRLADDAGYRPIMHTSYANQANLSESWFAATETLPPEEREAMVLNEPRPVTGAVYSEWSEDNIVDGWQYRPEMRARLAVDWGFRKPSVLVIAHDERLCCDVIFAELHPQEVTLDELARLILELAWPRAYKQSAPGPRIWLDAGAGDKAGAARSDRTALSSFRELSRKPPLGVGLKLRFTTNPIKTDILNGVQRLKRAIWRRDYRATRELWDGGRRCRGNSLRKALAAYGWDKKKEMPLKSGVEDPLDALRYDCIIWRWADDERLEQRTVPKMTPQRALPLRDRSGVSVKPWAKSGQF